MKANRFLQQLLQRKAGDDVLVDVRDVRPLSGNRLTVDGQTFDLTGVTANRMDAWLGYPSEMSKRIGEDTEQVVLDDLYGRWLGSRKVPSGLRITISDGQILGIRDERLAVLSFGRLAETLLTLESSEYPISQASVLCPRKVDDVVDQLDLRFVFETGVAEPRAGDIVRGGLRILCSGSGASPLSVSNYLERVWCTNGMTSIICRDNSHSNIRIRSRGSDDIEEMVKKFREVVALGLDHLSGKLRAVEQLAKNRIDNVAEVIEAIAVRHRLSKKTTKQLIQALENDEAGEIGSTSFDVINAVSRVATHGQIRQSVAERLSELAGGASTAAFHVCPKCLKVLHPSLN